jgi:chromatin structure-remodeling complex subunit SFH1
LGGEAVPLIAHAVHEELMKHKRDVVEWGVLVPPSAGSRGGVSDFWAIVWPVFGLIAFFFLQVHDVTTHVDSTNAMLKDKTGLGVSWGRTPRENRGPRVLRSVWRDWAEAEVRHLSIFYFLSFPLTIPLVFLFFFFLIM